MVERVFILSRITGIDTFVEADPFEIIFIRSCGQISRASRTGCARSSCTKSATLCAFCAGSCARIGVVTVRTCCQATAVISKEEEISIAGCWILALFGSIDTFLALKTACLAYVKNTGMNELAGWTIRCTSVCSDVFIVRGMGDSCDCINSDTKSDIHACLAVVETRLCASGTPISAFRAFVVECLLVKVGIAVLYTFVVL